MKAALSRIHVVGLPSAFKFVNMCALNVGAEDAMEATTFDDVCTELLELTDEELDLVAGAAGSGKNTDIKGSNQ